MASPYNTIGLYADGLGTISFPGGMYLANSGGYVKPSDSIIADYAYRKSG